MITKTLDEEKKYPFLFQAENEKEKHSDFLKNWIIQNKKGILSKKFEYGALLFRGFHINNIDDFQNTVELLSPNLLPYIEGQSERDKLQDQIYNSTRYPPNQKVTIHHELSYTNRPPGTIYFFCDRESETGGETPIVDSRIILTTLKKETLREFEGNSILYRKHMHSENGFGKSWQKHFETEDPKEVDKICLESGISFSWSEDNSLTTEQTRPAIRKHPTTNEDIWFNQASLWHVSNLGEKGETLLRNLGEEKLPTNAYFENKNPIPVKLLDDIRDTCWQNAVFFKWKKSDLLILDNFLMAHGRNNFTGDRNILVAIAD